MTSLAVSHDFIQIPAFLNLCIKILETFLTEIYRTKESPPHLLFYPHITQGLYVRESNAKTLYQSHRLVLLMEQLGSNRYLALLYLAYSVKTCHSSRDRGY